MSLERARGHGEIYARATRQVKQAKHNASPGRFVTLTLVLSSPCIAEPTRCCLSTTPKHLQCVGNCYVLWSWSIMMMILYSDFRCWPSLSQALCSLKDRSLSLSLSAWRNGSPILGPAPVRLLAVVKKQTKPVLKLTVACVLLSSENARGGSSRLVSSVKLSENTNSHTAHGLSSFLLSL